MCAAEHLRDVGAERTDCWIFDGVWYRKTENGTNDDHMMGELAHFNNTAIIIGKALLSVLRQNLRQTSTLHKTSKVCTLICQIKWQKLTFGWCFFRF